MSLAYDFGMYYNGTYVGFKKPSGEILPFYIDHVAHDHSVLDLSELARDDRSRVGYGEDAMLALVFRGSVYNEAGVRSNKRCSYGSTSLILETPDSKYVMINGKYKWLTYKPQRSTKKGICSRRLSGVNSDQLSPSLVREMYNERVDPIVKAGCLLHLESSLEYKGVIIATVDGNNISLDNDAAHLVRFIQRELPECQITVEPPHQ